MENWYELALSIGPHEPTSPFQHKDYDTEMASRVLELLMKDLPNGLAYTKLCNAYDHLFEL